jgi:hypothetical protein
MTIGRRLVLAVALGSVMAIAFASVAEATHPRPGGGTPFRVPLVPAYQQCTTAAQNSNHVAPLALDSCSPPVLNSTMLTTGTTGGMNASGRLDVFCNNGETPPCPVAAGDQEDIRVNTSVTDVRCSAVTPNCPAVGADYAGQMIGRSVIRITDHANATDPAPGAACASGTGAPPCVTATVLDLTFAVPVPCTTTPASTNGSNCALTTTIDTAVPTTVKELQRGIVSIFNLNVTDAGPDGGIGPACPPFCGTGDESTAVDQGIFIP